jgi:uncharacterized protein YqeY
MLKAAITNYEFAHSDPKSKDFGKPIIEADLLGVVDKQIKQRRESIEMYQQANRPELVAKEAAEIEVLEVYLPKPLTRDEIKVHVQAIMTELETKEFPRVMREAAARLKGRADGRVINEVVKELTT